MKKIAIIISLIIIALSCSIVKNGSIQREISASEKSELKERSINRINFLLNQKFPDKETKLLNELIQEVPMYIDGKENRLSEIAESLAVIIPKDDFLKIFMSDEKYTYNDGYIGENLMSGKDIQQLDKTNLRFLGGNKSDFIQLQKKPLPPDCDCRWWCGSSAQSYSTQACIATTVGCGFLLLQPCTYI